MPAVVPRRPFISCLQSGHRHCFTYDATQSVAGWTQSLDFRFTFSTHFSLLLSVAYIVPPWTRNHINTLAWFRRTQAIVALLSHFLFVSASVCVLYDPPPTIASDSPRPDLKPCVNSHFCFSFSSFLSPSCCDITPEYTSGSGIIMHAATCFSFVRSRLEDATSVLYPLF